jgi:hypothetical protein
LTVPLLRIPTSGYDNALIRENSLYLGWLAEDHILLNEIDLAAEIGTRVLELRSRANSARIDELLRHLAWPSRWYKDVQAVTGFLDQYKISACGRHGRHDSAVADDGEL